MKTTAITCAVALAGLLPDAGRAFAPDDVAFWVGAGTNEAALVVDWQDGETPDALAWGFRWNGSATAGDLLDAVAQADARLVTHFHPAYPTSILFGLGYDADGDGGRFATGFPLSGRETGYALDPDDRYREGWKDGYWSLWQGAGNPYAGGQWVHAGFGFTAITLTDGSWIGWGFDQDFTSITNGVDDAPRVPVAASSPYASGVTAYAMGTGEGVDPVLLLPLTNTAAVLGRPTIDTTGDNTTIPANEAVALVPVYPASRNFEIVSLGSNSELIVSFDQPVVDDPANPYGTDVVLFGNTFQVAGSWANGNPHDYTAIAMLGGDDGGTVSVSQDGTNWYAFTSGPYADAFAPTLGRRFDPDHPDPALGPSNAWWGAATDPRWPLDPSLAPADFAGLTVAEMCRAYGRSAGGASFDLAPLALPPDPGSGRKWFRYLRITSYQPWINVEVDAVCDVAPAKGYEGWQLEHFTFWQLTNEVVSAETADADGDGWTNLLEYVTGRDPWVDETEPLFETDTTTESNTTYFVVTYNRREELIDTVVLVEQTSDFTSWTTGGVDQAHVVTPTTGGLLRVEAWISTEQGASAARLRAYRP